MRLDRITYGWHLLPQMLRHKATEHTEQPEDYGGRLLHLRGNGVAPGADENGPTFTVGVTWLSAMCASLLGPARAARLATAAPSTEGEDLFDLG